MPNPVTTPKSAGKRGKKSKKRGARARGGKRSKGISSRKTSEAPEASLQVSSVLKLLGSTAPGPRMSIGEALRVHGLDEHAIAKTYVHVVGKLSGEDSDGSGVAKLLVDILKECSRQIEASQPPRASADAPVIVQLVHAVQRPSRAPLEIPAPSEQIADVPAAPPLPS